MKTSIVSSPSLDFVELIARSHFSFLQGSSSPDEMIAQAQKYDYLGFGLCDVNGLYGVARGYRFTKMGTVFDKADHVTRPDFRYHVGAEMTLPEGSVVLMPMTLRGYGHLCQLITKSKRSAEKAYSCLRDEDLFFHHEDLIAFVLPPWNEVRLERYREVFGDRLYLPVCRDLTWESKVHQSQAFFLEAKGFRLFASQRPYFHERSRKKLHDVMTCLYHQKTKSQAGHLVLSNSERCLHSVEELKLIWRDRLDLLQETKLISDRLKFQLNEIKYRYPQGELPESRTPIQQLRFLCDEGIKLRFSPEDQEKYKETIAKELQIIEELKYEDYFLTLWEICQFTKSRGILHQGRGSAANSIVCYLLGLTAVSPGEITLLFERFISKERSEPPDVDIDFEHERREEVIQHIYEKYGAERAGMVCNVICFRARMALREICKVYEISNEVVSEMVRFMGREGLSRIRDNPEIYKQWQIPPAVFFEVVSLVTQLRGTPRHLGIHSGGFVISQDPLTQVVPIEKATMEGRYVVQWNKDDVEALGLMKLDLLSLGMLTALRKCLDLLRSSKGIDWRLDQIPKEDPKTYDMICRAETVGVFQIESRAQMSLLPRLKPRKFYDLVIEVAIVRPGPIQGGMIHPFLRRRDGSEAVTYAHPKLEKVLHRTLGIPLFQEQIMQIVVEVADFKPGEADQMRRIMSNAWRKQAQMDGVYEKLKAGMRKNGIADAYIDTIYKTIEGFAAYGFPESHSASFALLTYVSCYLKCHHPDAFVCALLNSQPLGFYGPRPLISEAQRNGVRFKNPSVQTSQIESTLVREDGRELRLVQLGLQTLHGLPTRVFETIIEERECGGLYHDLNDFVRRTRLHASTVSKLALAGVFADLGISAREALWKIPSLQFDPQSLFFASEKTQNAAEQSWSPPKATEWDELLREYQATSYSVDRHPLLLMRPHLNRINEEVRRRRYGLTYVTSADLPNLPDKRQVRFAGLLSVQQKPPTSKGVSFLTLEDEFGFFNVVLMPKVYEQSRLLIRAQPLLEVVGKLEKVQGVYNIIASHVKAAPVFGEKTTSTNESPDYKHLKPRFFY